MIEKHCNTCGLPQYCGCNEYIKEDLKMHLEDAWNDFDTLKYKLALAIEALEEIERFQVLTRQDITLPMAMQGLCVQAIPGRHNTLVEMLNELPRKAVAMADALIEELSKEGANE